MVSDVWEVVETIPELSDGVFQIVRYAPQMERLRVRAGYAPERTADTAELLRRSTAVLEERLGVRVDIELRSADDLLSQTTSVAKFARVVTA
jgi:uncharacterized protein (DUF1684 family)